MKVSLGKRIRGISLMSTLLLVTIVLLVAATMAGVFTLNMNITQRVSNGTVALNEAEAGIAEVLYQISRDENVSKTENWSHSRPRLTSWPISVGAGIFCPFVCQYMMYVRITILNHISHISVHKLIF